MYLLSTLCDGSQKKWFHLAIIAICNLFGSFSLNLIAPFYTDVSVSRGNSVSDAGIVLGTSFMVTMVVTPLCGNFIHWRGAKFWLLTGSLLCSAGLFAFSCLDMVEDGWQFHIASICLRIVSASGEAIISPASFTFTARILEPELRPRGLMMMEAAFGAGYMLGPPLGGILFSAGGFSMPFWVTGSMLLASATFGFFVLPSTRNTEEQKVNSKNVNFFKICLMPRVIVSLSSLVVSGMAGTWYSSTLEPYLEEVYDYDPFNTGFVFMLAGVAYSVALPLVSLLVDMGANLMFLNIAGLTVTMLGFFLMAPIEPLVFSGGKACLYVSCLIQGAGYSGTYLGTMLYMNQGLQLSGIGEDEKAQGIVASMFIIGDCVGAYLGAVLGGVSYQRFDFSWSLLILVAAMVAATLVLLLVWAVFRKALNRPVKFVPAENGEVAGAQNVATTGKDAETAIDATQRKVEKLKVTLNDVERQSHLQSSLTIAVMKRRCSYDMGDPKVSST